MVARPTGENMTAETTEPERRVRRMSGHDSEVAAGWFRAQQPISEVLSRELPNLLKMLIEQRIVTAACVERRDHSRGTWELDGFGLSAFLADAAVSAYYDEPPPFLDMLLLERCRAGETAACFLSAEDIARANAGAGLNLLGLTWLQSTYDFRLASGRKLLEMSFQLMIGFHRGYRLQRAMHIGWADYAEAMKAAGFAEYKQPASEPDSPYLNHPNGRARLYGRYTAADSQRLLPGSPISYLFTNSRPIFALTAAEQVVVELALADLADAGVAHELGTTVTAVQQRWKRIYQRVTEVDPVFFGDTDDQRPDAVRGNERRRFVLNYIRNHPEELRPYDVSGVVSKNA